MRIGWAVSSRITWLGFSRDRNVSAVVSASHWHRYNHNVAYLIILCVIQSLPTSELPIFYQQISRLPTYLCNMIRVWYPYSWNFQNGFKDFSATVSNKMKLVRHDRDSSREERTGETDDWYIMNASSSTLTLRIRKYAERGRVINFRWRSARLTYLWPRDARPEQITRVSLLQRTYIWGWHN